MVPRSVLLPSVQPCSDLTVLPCVQGLNICRLLLTGQDAMDTLPPPSGGKQLQEEWEGTRTLGLPPQPCVGEKPRRQTAASRPVVQPVGRDRKTRIGRFCLETKLQQWQGWQPNKGLVRKKGLQHAEPLTGLWKFKAKSAHRVVLASWIVSFFHLCLTVRRQIFLFAWAFLEERNMMFQLSHHPITLLVHLCTEQSESKENKIILKIKGPSTLGCCLQQQSVVCKW